MSGSPEESSSISVLIVDDTDEDRFVLQRLLQRGIAGCRIHEARNCAEARKAYEELQPDVIFFDHRLPDGKGLELMTELGSRANERDHHPAMIFFTASLDTQTAVEAMRLGAHDYASKARITAVDLRRIVLNALDRSRLRREVDAQREELHGKNRALEKELAARETAEKLLRSTMALSHSIFESSGDGITILDLEGRVLEMNGRQIEMEGVDSLAAVQNKSLTELFHIQGPEAKQMVARALEETREGRTGRFQTKTGDPGNEVKWWDVQITPIFDEGRRPVKLLAISRDITEAKVNEKQLREAKASAENANRAKEDFLATLSHELRTPLNPVLLLASEFENDQNISPELRSGFTTIRKNVELEAQLIDDLLDLTRISRGKMRLELKTVNVHESIVSTCDLLAGEFEQKKISLSYNLAGGPAWMQGDPVRLHQIFWNIVKNAIRFTSRGGSIFIITERRGNDRLRVRVKDTGEGIDPAELKSIFGAFDQGSDGYKGGGLGLGLAITQGLAQIHGGTVWAESEGRGLGAEFVVELPLSDPLPEAQTLHIPSPARKAGQEVQRILLIEDHRETSTALTMLLTKRGFDVRATSTIRETLEVASSYPFDLILSDISLPDGTGYDLIAELRKIRPGAAAIAMSGHGMESDRQKSSAAGFKEYLVKPVRIVDLEQAISRVNAREA